MDNPQHSIRVALIGASIGLLFAIVRSYAARGDIGQWEWIVLPAIVAVLFLWLDGHFDKAERR